jgi:hypothetical protein
MDGDRAIVLARVEEMSRDGVRWFYVESSYGLRGWVVARSVAYVRR